MLVAKIQRETAMIMPYCTVLFLGSLQRLLGRGEGGNDI